MVANKWAEAETGKGEILACWHHPAALPALAEKGMCYCPRMSSRPTNFTPARRPQHRPNARGATEFLQTSEGIAPLLGTLETLVRLQTDCERLLPPALTSCKVLKLHENILQLAVPNAAVATRLRHSLPGLTSSLREKGWPIDTIKINVKNVAVPASSLRTYDKAPPLPDSALLSFAALARSIEVTPGNTPLIEALDKLLSKRKLKA
jgi:hypothetical protein